jgi:hypothetical protein
MMNLHPHRARLGGSLSCSYSSETHASTALHPIFIPTELVSVAPCLAATQATITQTWPCIFQLQLPRQLETMLFRHLPSRIVVPLRPNVIAVDYLYHATMDMRILSRIQISSAYEFEY